MCLLGAWFYTGGSRPYGYRGLGELAVFVFFGPVAVLGTEFVQTGRASGLGIGASVGVGLLACAVLVANNLRDIGSDVDTGKRTLAVVLGDRDTRVLYAALVVVPLGMTLVLSLRAWGALAGLLALVLLVPGLAARPRRVDRPGPDPRAARHRARAPGVVRRDGAGPGPDVGPDLGPDLGLLPGASPRSSARSCSRRARRDAVAASTSAASRARSPRNRNSDSGRATTMAISSDTSSGRPTATSTPAITATTSRRAPT